MKVFDVKKDSLDYEYSYHINEKKRIKEKINNQRIITVDDLRRIALWKYDRIIEVDDEFLFYLYSVISPEGVCIDDKKVQEVISRLVECEGVGFPLASTILKFINPDVFPIIDVRAYRAIYGRKIYYSQYNLERYIEYTKIIYRIKEELGLPLSEVDERLYVFDKEHNGKI